ncbi:hypothetical protein N7466_002509 [Penicillium verhagenii]|uniref:uncharacterized protein n=1 Tax=Penicillium verhagenii TaxID=1562060 RepID=UPI00254520FD|nr:uncharacterized protein N7466_002509 [Penicillium verhagenii]KAJ5939375.1 hypothetical protein N7466_002509 [Penicillium verhagenii]
MLDNPPRVLFFDTFGTVVEWRSCVTKALSDAAHHALQDPDRDLPADVRQRAATLSQSDWLAFAEEWRLSYKLFTHGFDSSKDFVSVDQHHYRALQDLLEQRGIRKLFKDSELWELTLCWHRLTPWPDSVAGLDLLNTKFITSTLSNGNESLLQDLKQHGNLPFTRIVGAENFGAYKPSPSVYHGAAKLLDRDSTQCTMVAAHLGDLEAARDCGFQTIYVERELEESWSADRIAQAKEEGWVDIWVGLEDSGFMEVARKLGVEGK